MRLLPLAALDLLPSEGESAARFGEVIPWT